MQVRKVHSRPCEEAGASLLMGSWQCGTCDREVPDGRECPTCSMSVGTLFGVVVVAIAAFWAVTVLVVRWAK